MYSSMVRTKCADLFLSWDATSKLLEYKCLICEKWFDLQVEEIAQHLLNCVRQMISISSHQPDNGLAEADDEDVENCEYLVDSDTDEEVQEQLDSNAVEAPDYLDYNDEVNDESVSPSTMLEAKDIPLPAAADRADYGTKTELLEYLVETADTLCQDQSAVEHPNPADMDSAEFVNRGAPAIDVRKRRRKSSPNDMKLSLTMSKENNDFTRCILTGIQGRRTNKPLLECDLCKVRFNFRSDIYKHMRMEHIDKDRTCTGCAVTFSRHTELRKHMRQHSATGHTCEFCGTSFRLKVNLASHIRIHTRELPYACKECGKRFRQSSSMHKHYRVIHSGDKPHKCDQCAESFVAPYVLVRHINRKHLNQPLAKPHACDQCPMRFRGLGELIDHSRKHTGERPFNCIFCQRSFGRKDALQAHENTHTGNAPCKCRFCDRQFHSNAARRSHEKNVHSGK